MNLTALRGIIVILLMKLCNKIVEMHFATINPTFFRVTNGTIEASEHLIPSGIFYDSQRTSNSMSSFASWIFTARNTLPVLGGLLSSVWFGYVRVLQIGGVIMLLSTVLMSVSVYTGLMCQSSPIVPITWLLLPLIFGISQPNLVHGIFQWYRLQRQITILSAVYLFSAFLGEFIELMLTPINQYSSLGSHSTLFYVGLSLAFIAASFALPKDEIVEPFEFPTHARLLRYFQIFSGRFLFILSVSDTQFTVYTAEIKYYMNGTHYFQEHALLSPNWLNHIAILTSCLILILVAALNVRQLPLQPRLQMGITLKCTVAASLTIFTAIGSSNTVLVEAVYSTATVVDAAAEVLIMVAIYELAQLVAPRNSRTFVFGIVFAVWGLASLTGRLLLLFMESFLAPRDGNKPRFYIYHITEVAVLIVCSIYHRFLAIPLAMALIPADSDAPESEEDPRTLQSPEDA